MRIAPVCLAAVALIALPGCSSKKGAGAGEGGGADGVGGGGGSSDGADGGADSMDGGSDSGEVDEWNTFLSGTVRIQLYETNGEGDIEFIGWPSSYNGEFPFGDIFVGAIRADLPTDAILELGATSVPEPDPDGNEFTIGMALDTTESVLVYGALDYWGNRIIHNNGDPVGNYPTEITVNPGDFIEDLSFTILAPYEDFGGRTAAEVGVSEQRDERSYCDDVEISGVYEVTIDNYEGGNAMAMLMDRDGYGPHDWGEAILTPDPEGGASGTYSFTTCSDQGYVILRGRWDSNKNGLYDPHDMYGAFAVSPGVNGNPVAVATVNLDDMPIESPLDEDAASVNLVPFVRMSGTLAVPDGFDSFPTGTSVVVAAAKYRFEGDLELEELDEKAYGYKVFEWPDITGKSSVDWSVVVPANTLLYLWAYADENANGTVNESGEAVASGGDDDNGRFQTSSANSTHDLILARAEGR